MHDSGQFAAMHRASDWGQLIARAEQGLREEGLPPEKEGQLRYWLGLGFAETGDLYRAEGELQRMVELGERFPALVEMQADALSRLGQIHRLLRRPEQEVAAFRRAAHCHHRLRQTQQAARCHAEAAWTLLLSTRTEEALTELKAAAAGLKANRLPDLAIQVGIVQALYLHRVGKWRAADQLCLEILDRPPLRPAQRADIAWILACNALAAGAPSIAAFHAVIAQGCAVEAWSPVQMERIDHLRKRLASGGGESRPSSPQG